MLTSILTHQVGEILTERESIAEQKIANLWGMLGLGAGVYILCVVIGVAIYLASDHDGILAAMLILGFPISFLVTGAVSSPWFAEEEQYKERLEAAVINNVEQNINIEEVEITKHNNWINHEKAYSAELIGLSNGEYVTFTVRYNDEHGFMIPVVENNADLAAREGSDLETLLNDSENAS